MGFAGGEKGSDAPGAGGGDEGGPPAPLAASSSPATSSPAVKHGHANHVVVHPLVLLSVTDHFNRDKGSAVKRAVGVLLGERSGNTVDISNAYAGTLLFIILLLFALLCIILLYYFIIALKSILE